MLKLKLERLEALQLTALILVYLVLPLLFRGSYQLRVLNLLVVFTLLTFSANIIFGHTRQLFLCQGALAGIGAYLSSLLALTYKISPWIFIPFGVAAAAAAGLLLSFVSVARGLEVIFVGIVTLGFSLIYENLIIGLEQYTRGSTGFVPPDLELGILGQVLGREMGHYYLLVGILAAVLFVYIYVIKSKAGMAFDAITEDETAAKLIGINVRKYKLYAALLGSVILGLTGAIYGHYNAYIGPGLFSISSIDITVLVMLVFGGRATALGPVIGSITFTIINELIRPLGPLTIMIYGALLVVLFLFFREGLVQLARKWVRLI